MRITTFILTMSMGVLAGCGIVYNTPSVYSVTDGDNKVRVVEMTPASVMTANTTPYTPRALPDVFKQTAGSPGQVRVNSVTLPEPVFDNTVRTALEVRVPPAVDPGPYKIGVGDVVLLATPQAAGTVAELSGLLAAQTSRQGYTVQDDGSIAIPNVGRVQIAGMTLEEAEAALFQRLVSSQIDPTFSLEIADFNSKKVSIGGAVTSPSVVPITLTPLDLDEALAAAGGVTVTDKAYASIRLYRDGSLYQIPLSRLYSDASLQKIRLIDGDSIFVDTAYNLDLAQSYFQEQIARATFKQSSRTAALGELNSEFALRRAVLEEMRSNYQASVGQDAVPRDYVYLTGEMQKQGRFTLPLERQATLADAIYSTSGMPNNTANAKEIYVLRGSDAPQDFGTVTAWRLNIKNAGNLILATRFQMRPNDVVFVAEQPITRWNRVLNQIIPSLLTTGVSAATN